MLCQECKAVLKQPMSLKESNQLEFLAASFQYHFEAKATHCYSCRGILRQLGKHSHLQLQGGSALQIHYSHRVRANQTRDNPRLRGSVESDGLSLGGTQYMDFEQAQDEVIWDCAELTACESLPHGTKAWSGLGARLRKFGCKQGSYLLTPAKTVDEGVGQWETIVDTYSACGLTVLGDKLIAISGVANHLRDELKMEYCFGLWRPKMEMQLAWIVNSLQDEKTPRNDLAPSWSWASINGAVDLQQVYIYQGYDVSPRCSITEVSLRRETQEHRGEKVVGYLRMRCVLNPITLEGDAKPYRMPGKGMEHGRAALVDSPDVVGAERLFFVSLFDVQASMSLEHRWKVSSEIRGIIVQGVIGCPGVYTRCGHAFISGAVRDDTRKFDETYGALKSPAGKAELPCEEYDADSGHLIKLV